jgi:RNA polymerase sigma-70 factor, ECF subfamily
MRRFVDAWEAVDIERLTQLLAGKALMTMPPEQMRVEGAAAIGAFFATVPLGGRLDLIRLLPARSNGQPALGAYVEAAPYGLMVFALEGTRIVGITGFTGSPELFRAPGFRPSCADGPSVRGRNLLRPHCR